MQEYLQKPDESEIKAPPFFKKWRGMYIFLIVFLVIQIIIYYLITLYF